MVSGRELKLDCIAYFGGNVVGEISKCSAIVGLADADYMGLRAGCVCCSIDSADAQGGNEERLYEMHFERMICYEVKELLYEFAFKI